MRKKVNRLERVIGGDWNEILHKEDKVGGREKSIEELAEFQNFIARMGVYEVCMQGHQFTWCNNRRDHSLLVLYDDGLSSNKRKPRFQLDSRWVSEEGLEEVVSNTWSSLGSGTPMFNFKEKIKKTRIALLKWSQALKSENAKKVEQLTIGLEEIKAKGGEKNWDCLDKVKRELEEAQCSVEEFWRQQSRNQWLTNGNRNTKFFHALTMKRRKTNAIKRLVVENGKVCESKQDIDKAIVNITLSYSPLLEVMMKSRFYNLSHVPSLLALTRSLWLMLMKRKFRMLYLS
ncbi:reverse transcriptase [Striga asiatica]|uniref:Reverse transcriptase n=1 Tax=Striga asiatica TaxID=4170 RepID=A0A5A7PZL1_STRAF|nr:reverse transcriptase [Striga asiatica]